MRLLTSSEGVSSTDNKILTWPMRVDRFSQGTCALCEGSGASLWTWETASRLKPLVLSLLEGCGLTLPIITSVY